MSSHLQKAIDLSRKTGDRIIVFDSAKSDKPFVVMDLNEYEKMVLGYSEVRGLTEDELLDKINRDIAIWKSDQDYGSQDKQTAGDFVDVFPNTREEKPVDANFNIAQPVFSDFDFDQAEKPKQKWSIPSERKEAAEEVIEEDRQYLEDIKF